VSPIPSARRQDAAHAIRPHQHARAGHRGLAALLRGAWLRAARAASVRGAYNVYLGLPGDGDTLELTVNEGQTEPYDLGSGYGHIAPTVEHLDAKLEELAAAGIEPEKPPYHPGGSEEFRICFVRDPDGYRIELIDGAFATPQD
jgi:lactoylglutathione lyase